MNHVNWWLKFSMFSDILVYYFSYNLYLKGGGARAEVIWFVVRFCVSFFLYISLSQKFEGDPSKVESLT